MADNVSFFASFFGFFQAVWTSIFGIFRPKWSLEHQPKDVEAAITPASAATTKVHAIPGLKKGLPINNLEPAIDSIAKFSSSPQHDPKFVSAEPVQFTIGDVEDGNDFQRRSINYDHPSRKPSRRQSAVDPVKARILDDTFKHVQDKALDVVKAVVITPGTVFPVECSAQIEYYHGPIAEACSVQVEYFPGPVVETCSARVDYCAATIVTEACSAQVEYYNGPTKDRALVEDCDNSSSTVIGESSTYFDDTCVDAQDLPERVDVTLEIESYLSKLQGTLESFKNHTILPKQPSLKSGASTPRLKKKHNVQFAMYPEEVPFTPVPERTSRRHRERRDKKRSDLFDVLAQFPAIPAFVPTCPPGRISPGTQIPETVSDKYAYRTRESTSSTESDSSTSSFGNSLHSGAHTNGTTTSSSGICAKAEEDGPVRIASRSYTYF